MRAVDLPSVEERLAGAPAAPVLVDPRLLRRIIKRHRAVPGIGLEVPHARCYAIRRDALLAIVSAAELGRAAASLPEEIILLPRPTDAELRHTSTDEVLTGLWRGAFHAAVHLEIERRIAAGALSASRIRERIHRIGETEFDEVRLVLRHDESLLPPYDDRETFTEFAALYLELRSFDPGVLDRLFPTLRDRARVDGAIDLDPAPLLALTRPLGLPEVPERVSVVPPSERTRRSVIHEPEPPQAPSVPAMERLFARAEVARRQGNDVRAALLGLAAHAVAPRENQADALARVRGDLDSLALRLDRALQPEGVETEASRAAVLAAWTPVLLGLARSGFRRTLRHTVSARLLLDLQSAAVARERPQSAVDLVEFALSLGRRPIVRPLPMAAFVRVVTCLHHAHQKLRFIALDSASRRALIDLLHDATERAEQNVRGALRPRIVEVLDAVGLAPRDAPERLARAKLTDELLDQAVHHGFLGIGHLRDAISRNQLKLESLSGPRELLSGDPLLKADRRLGIALDGVYRRAEIYLRTLQRLSSLAFGTAPGRFLTLYLILPLGGAFVMLEGLSHLLSLIVGLFGHHHHVHLLHTPSLIGVGVALFGLIHSAGLRGLAHRALAGVGWLLKGLFVRLPRFVANLPAVRAALRSRPVRAVIRYLVKPGLVTAVLWLLVYWIVPAYRDLPRTALAGVAVGLLVALDIALISPVGLIAEEAVDDWIATRFRVLSREVLPGLWRLTFSTFRYLTDLVERAVYTVDEWLRFRQGQSVVALAAKAVLGLVWFFIAYALRIYVNLLIEPQINPIKHFPVVTVSHKIVLPMAPTIFHAMQSALAPVVGSTVARAIAGPTVFLIPGVFGFLVWEFKENWKLYRENRAKTLGPAVIGHHGESMGALMKPGFHSGTLPKLYQKLRRAAQGGDDTIGKYEESLHEVEEAVRHFGARELAAILNGSRRFSAGEVRVDGVELGSNRITLVVRCGAPQAASAHGHGAAGGAGAPACRIAFEEQSGLVIASVPEAGWLDALGDEDRVIVENALAGLYHFAGVDVVREQLESALRGAAESAPPYDIGSGGLVVWPAAEGSIARSTPGDGPRSDRDATTEIFYGFRGGTTLSPVTRGEPPADASPQLESGVVFYSMQPITWTAWVGAWNAASAEQGAIPRLLDGASILPRKSPREAHSAA
jgi:hypothetical protein